MVVPGHSSTHRTRIAAGLASLSYSLLDAECGAHFYVTVKNLKLSYIYVLGFSGFSKFGLV